MAGQPEQSANISHAWMFPFERHFDHVYFAQWAKDTRPHCVAICLAYVVFIYLGRRWMSTRVAWDLRLPLALWNGLLALFSVVGAVRLSPEFRQSLAVGWRHSICDNSRLPLNAAGFWMIAFMLSKVAELIDTAFIILRRRPLIFLHWYHHVSVLLLTWYAVGVISSTGRWYANMNYWVHSLMYAYYSLSSFGFKIPRAVALLITSLQIAQMIMGILVTVAASVIRLNGGDCQVDSEIIAMFFVVYFTYFLLFLRYFYNTYVAGDRKKTQKSAAVEQNGRHTEDPKLTREAINDRAKLQQANGDVVGRIRKRNGVVKAPSKGDNKAS